MAINEADILNGLDVGTDADKLFSLTPDDPLVKVTQKFLQASIDNMKQILTDKKRNATSSLAQSLQPTEIKSTSTGFEVGITGNGYGEFVDKGVNAYTDAPFTEAHPNKGHAIVTNAHPNADGKVYAFKSLNVSPSFAESIKQWIPAKPVGLPNTTQLAYMVGINIKKRGIEPANFIGGTFTPETLNEFSKAITDITGKALALQFSKFGD